MTAVNGGQLRREEVAEVAERYPVLADRLEGVAAGYTKWLGGGVLDLDDMIDRPAKVEPVQTPVEKLAEKVSELENQLATVAKQQKEMHEDILKRFDQLLAKSE